VGIPVPHAPCDRCIGFRQLLEYGDAVHWRQVEPAIGRRQENAKKLGVCEVMREIFGQRRDVSMASRCAVMRGW
jgi:hypothetical protein